MINMFKRFNDRLKEYIFDSSADIKDKSFVLFSITVLIALFLAIPCGLIMKEPPSATIATIIGTVLFTAYVAFSIKRKKIKQARIVISIVLVFVFLPAMFFTNGGVEGGTPIWLLLGTIYITMILSGRLKTVMIVLNAVVTIGFWMLGYFFPELVTEYGRGQNYFDSIAALFIVSWVVFCLITFQNTLLKKETEDQNIRKLFKQTATALVNAIDAKDKYTHGHSSRVAEYSRRIALESGLSPRECEDIYFVALLHDVGKIGVPESIINKEGKLTPEEYEKIKEHPTLGAQILNDINEIPFISIGAHYHHERYDGKGYPAGLIGTDIPLFARIISVADAYDAMTSMRSYRDPIPQQQVREELVKGSGTQFDPEFARIMVHLIDLDIEYRMKERREVKELDGRSELVIKEHRGEVSEGLLLMPNMLTLSLKIDPLPNSDKTPKPSIILFDSLDSRFHDSEKNIRDLNYFEYGEIWFDGTSFCNGARKFKTTSTRFTPDGTLKPGQYIIKAVKRRDHALIRIIGYNETHETIVALPDKTRYVYLGLTGEKCVISDLSIEKSNDTISDDYIPRIAEEISYINVPDGDIPNVEIDSYRTAASEGIPVTDGLKITFHAFSLPTARLVWHCPFINIFTSDNGEVTGDNYRDYMLTRLDGECWEGDEDCDVDVYVNRNEFNGWDAWKQFNKNGFDCTVTFERHDNTITLRTENSGIVIRSTAVVKSDNDKIYVAITGDQCAITNIRFSYGTIS